MKLWFIVALALSTTDFYSIQVSTEVQKHLMDLSACCEAKGCDNCGKQPQ